MKLSVPPLFKRFVWVALSVLFGIITIVSLWFSLFSLSPKSLERAIENGQRVELILASGVIIGKTRVVKQEAPAPLTYENFIGPQLPEKPVDVIEKTSISELSDKPVVVIIIKGVGLSASSSQRAIELPPEVTIGLSPYSPHIKEWSEKAISSGHETVLNIPMETRDYRLDDPGPYALITSSSKSDNETRLKMLISLISGYKAVYSERKEIFTNAVTSVKPVLELLKKQNIFFIYGGGYGEFSLIQIANKINYPLLIVDVVLDEEISVAAINSKLDAIVDTATEKGYAVAMAHPYPITIDLIARWIDKSESLGVKLVPVSMLLGKSFE